MTSEIIASGNRDEAQRVDFQQQLGDPKAAHLVDVDEAGMDERDDYEYGWSPAGERVYGSKSGRRHGRANMIAGYRNGQLIAPFTVEGHATAPCLKSGWKLV